MQYEELVKAVRDSVQNAQVSKTVGHAAFQFNIEGEARGAFYLEISDGKIFVEPYEYYDRDIIITTSAEILMQIVEGKIKARAAYTNNQIKIQGENKLLDILPFDGTYKSAAKVTDTVKTTTATVTNTVKSDTKK